MNNIVLSAHDFAELAEPSSAYPVDERRRWQRQALDLQGFYQVVPARPNELWWGARVRDISPGGVGFVTHRSFAPGTELGFELIDPLGEPVHPGRIHVVYSFRLLDGGWLVGGRLANPLREELLEFLLP